MNPKELLRNELAQDNIEQCVQEKHIVQCSRRR